MPAERIQKVLARAGLGSRREVESWIADGRLTISGKTPEPGLKITGKEKIYLDGKLLEIRLIPSRQHHVVMYHKPVGVICSRKDPEGRHSAFDDLPELEGGRWVSVGRLDINTCGLLLFTSDGELANALMHPSSEVAREYAVRVLGSPTAADLKQLTSGVQLDDGPASFDRIKVAGGEGANRWYDVVLKEGRKREVRRIWEALGFKVSRLIRIRYGPIRLHRDLKPGTTRDLTDGETRELYQAVGLVGPAGPARKSTARGRGAGNSSGKASGKSRSGGQAVGRAKSDSRNKRPAGNATTGRGKKPARGQSARPATKAGDSEGGKSPYRSNKKRRR